jgi:hypothetical protein
MGEHPTFTRLKVPPCAQKFDSAFEMISSPGTHDIVACAANRLTAATAATKSDYSERCATHLHIFDTSISLLHEFRITGGLTPDLTPSDRNKEIKKTKKFSRRFISVLKRFFKIGRFLQEVATHRLEGVATRQGAGGTCSAIAGSNGSGNWSSNGTIECGKCQSQEKDCNASKFEKHG